MTEASDYAGLPADRLTREECAEDVFKVEALRERFLLEAEAFAKGVWIINPDFVDRWEHATRARTATHDEAIEGFMDCIRGSVADLIDAGQIERSKRIAESGRE